MLRYLAHLLFFFYPTIRGADPYPQYIQLTVPSWGGVRDTPNPTPIWANSPLLEAVWGSIPGSQPFQIFRGAELGGVRDPMIPRPSERIHPC